MPPPASLRVRTPAFLTDQLVVLLLVCGPLVLAGVPVRALVRPGTTRTGVFLVLMAVAFAYHFVLEWRTGRTPGKRLFGLRVVGAGGEALSFRASFLRNALRLVDGLGYWSVAVLVIRWRGDGKRLGDVAGRSLVVTG